MNDLGIYANRIGTFFYQQRMIAKKGIALDNYTKFLDLHLSNIGMGTYLGQPDRFTDTLVEQAFIKSVKSGVNVVDTAINYRFQRAERTIGSALKKIYDLGFKRDEIFISTKAGYVPGDFDKQINVQDYIDDKIVGKNLASKEEIINYNCVSIPFIEHQLEQSLKNLNIDAVDLLYLHNVAESQKPTIGDRKFYEMMAESFEFLEKKRYENKIHYYGMATWDCFRVKENDPDYVNLSKIVQLSKKAADLIGNEEFGLKFVMVPYNLAMQEADKIKNQDGRTFFERATELGIGVFTSVPLSEGKFLNQPELRDLAVKLRVETPAQAAIQFVRMRGKPIVSTVIGHKKREHVKENLEVLKLKPILVH